MLAVIYIFICMLCGFVFCRFAFGDMLAKMSKIGGENERVILLPDYFVQLPAWYLTGTLLVSWLVYLVSWCFQKTEKPLFYGNLTVLTLLAALLLAYFYFFLKKQTKKMVLAAVRRFFVRSDWYYPVYALAAILFVSFLMFLTFYVSGGVLHVGFSVFSDFAPHLGMIRSFSMSNNFPTQYAHYAGEDIRYHFMFQFMVGNLEYLGMRIDWAFNLPSILGMVSVYLLLFVLTVRITKTKLCGYLTVLLFTFRSSFTVFRYMAKQPKGTVWTALKENTEFLGFTEHEDWGLWNLNVYCNQRHLAFSLAILLLALLFFYPYMEAMGRKLAEALGMAAAKMTDGSGKKAGTAEDSRLFAQANARTNNRKGVSSGNKKKMAEASVTSGNQQLYKGVGRRLTVADVKTAVKTMFFTKTAFGIQNWKASLCLGIVLGGIAFWNGSVLVATLSMLFFMAAVSDARLDYLITALTALVLSLLQTSFFIDGSAVSPSYYFGFLASNKTAFGVIVFIVELTGIVLLAALAGACCVKGMRRYLLLVFLVPFALAFTLSLTVDITVNHKWIMMSLMLVSVFAAYFLAWLWHRKDWLLRIVAVLLLAVLTATGIYDCTIVIKRNKNYMNYELADKVTEWVAKNADCDDIFLTPYYSLNNVVLGGAMLYYGWPYYSWSAGYDTAKRRTEVGRMYEAPSVEELDARVRKNGIRYIIVDHDCRTSSEYTVREDIIEAAYDEVFTKDTGDWAVRIFDTEKKK